MPKYIASGIYRQHLSPREIEKLPPCELRTFFERGDGDYDVSIRASGENLYFVAPREILWDYHALRRWCAERGILFFLPDCEADAARWHEIVIDCGAFISRAVAFDRARGGAA